MPDDSGDAPRKRRPYATRMPADQRREQVLDAALQLAVSRGLREVNMESVARESGVTKPVVYSLFPNADALLDALVEREQLRAAKQVQQTIPANLDFADPVSAASAGITGFLSAVRNNADTWKLLLSADQLPGGARAQRLAAREHLIKQITVLAEVGLSERRSGPLDADLLARLIVVGANAGARLVLDDPETFNEERMVTFVTELARSIQEG